MRMHSTFRLVVCTVMATAGLSTAVVADDWDTCAKQTGDVAIAACSRAIASGRWKGQNLARTYFNRGAEYNGKDERDRAIADFDQAIRLDPKDAKAYKFRGDAWAAKREFDLAISDYDRALRLDP